MLHGKKTAITSDVRSFARISADPR